MIFEIILKISRPNPVNLSLGTKWSLNMAISRATKRFQNWEFDTRLPSMSPKGLVHPKGARIYLFYEF